MLFFYTVFPYIAQITLFFRAPNEPVKSMSLVSKFFPDSPKIARVSLVFKSGNPEAVHDYMPVSVLFCFPEMLERITYNRFIFQAI